MLYEITNIKSYKLAFMGTFPAKTYAKNEILKYSGQNKKFIIIKTFSP